MKAKPSLKIDQENIPFGEYWYKIDAKGRTKVPGNYIRRFDAEVLALVGPTDRCITGFPLKKALSRDKQKNSEQIADGIVFIRIDSRGRITIPANLRKHAGIEGSVIFVALNDFFEFWSEKHWNGEKAEAYREAFGVSVEQGAD